VTTYQQSLFKELEKANKNLKKVIYSAAASIEKSVQQIVDAGANDVRERISKPGSGKEYTYSYGPHRASSPGEPPSARIGGPLYKSIVSQITQSRKDGDKGRVEGYYGANIYYAPFLEYGWRRKSSVGEPRPFMRPSAEYVRSITPGIVARNWIKNRNAAIKKLSGSSKNSGADQVSYVGKMR
jgi:hypothetical protein